MEVVDQEHNLASASLLPLGKVEGRVGLKKSSIYSKVAAGTFPAPIKLSATKNVWDSRQIDKWVNDRIRDSVNAAKRGAA